MKHTGFRQSAKQAAFLFDQMLVYGVTQSMKNTVWRIGLPIIGFELVAGVAAIYQVFFGVCATPRTGLKVVKGQFGSRVYLAGVAVAAPKSVPVAD